MSDASEHKSASATPPNAAGDAAPKEVQPGHDPLLEQAVDDLLHQMDEAEQSVKAAVAEETQQELDDLAALTKEAQAPAAVPQEDNLTDVVDALLEQQEAPSGAETVPVVAEARMEASAPVAEEVAVAPVEEVATEPVAESAKIQTAAAPVETAKPAEVAPVASAPVAAAVPQPQEAVKPEVTPTLADLDRELAGVANEMLAKEQIAPPVPVSPAPIVQATETPSQTVTQEVTATADSATKIEDLAHSAQSRAQQAKAAMHTAIAHASPKAKAAGSWLKVHVEPTAIAMLAGISKPIASKPKAFKHSLGLVALYTLFIASAFWGYALFLRPTQAKTTEAQPFDFQKSGLPSPEVTERSEGHGEAKAESGGHGDAKKKDDGHGGGGHGDAKGGKKEAKKPVLNSADAKSVINKTLEDRKKKPAEAKKDGGGHGGGH